MAFTDDDCVVPEGWLGAIRKVTRENPDASLIYGQVVAASMELPPGAYIPELRFSQAEKFSPRGKFRVIGMGANFAARRSDLLGIGGFDEALGGGGIFRSSQDFDMQFRLWRAGKVVMIHPDILVMHYGLRTVEQWPLTARAYGFGDGAFYMKHVRFRDPTAIRLLAGKVLRETATPLVRAIRRRPYAADYAVGLLQGARAGLRQPLIRNTRRYRLDA
jgi:GT2 family glycosyltransferase